MGLAPWVDQFCSDEGDSSTAFASAEVVKGAQGMLEPLDVPRNEGSQSHMNVPIARYDFPNARAAVIKRSASNGLEGWRVPTSAPT